ncbi:hypothetical protein [Hydrogenimonas sp.]
MKKALFLSLFVLSLLAIDWSDRSTKELLAALQNAKGSNVEVILHELKKREPLMSPMEKKAYEEALKKLHDGR